MPLTGWISRIADTSVVPSRRVVSRLAGVGLSLLLTGGQVEAHEGAGQDGGVQTTVAAGFGYQNETDSTITVKVYDAASGDVLSEEVYELSIREDRNTRSTAQEARIFAGGVGVGQHDLSNFVVRVYDAKTGAFQWTGQLNLAANGSGGLGEKVSTVIPRRAVVMKIHDTVESGTPHPLFLLRAWDLSTGGLMWEDEFSPDGIGAGSASPIAVRSAMFDGGAPGAGVFDFRILMVDPSRRMVLWEDQVFQQENDEDVRGEADDRAEELPAWTEPIPQESPLGRI